MFTFLARRIASGLVLIVVVSAIAFTLVYSDGNRIARVILGPTASQESVQQRAEELGLNDPLPVQFARWFGGLLRGDLGNSLSDNRPVIETLSLRIPVTLTLVIFTLIVTVIIAVAIGLFSAYKGGWMDSALRIFGVFGFATPHFIIAIALVAVFALALGILPATGYVTPSKSVEKWIASLILPVTALAVGTIASASQQIRGAVRDVLRQDYIRTLRSRGIPLPAIYLRHALKNASAPGLTTVALQFIGLLGGAVVIERVFALPGLGTLIIDAALKSDIPVIMGTVLFSVVVVVVVNVVVDLTIAWANPKARNR
ncbi:MAG: ABC transporter permease [Microbacteriaceae bacterium]|jgi:peptide/nickel transport system permease protein|nr:ABC transporter permease [Microbacteriaceae bacterium]HOB56125.1 ABC transporter permease [Rhodoglobus sp.]HOY80960.1 ABC transporter permease [Rhodoglobus sp.]HPG75067.1 ABC transporter permease [Rhodoglobus sp.]HPU02304.1 ABC transporter permease [Rhodoglobus sp.]